MCTIILMKCGSVTMETEDERNIIYCAWRNNMILFVKITLRFCHGCSFIFIILCTTLSRLVLVFPFVKTLAQ